MSAAQAPTTIDLAVEPDFNLGTLEVRPSLREVLVSGEREVLEPRVMQVLVALSRRRGQVVSRDQLIDECWAGRVVGEDAINRCIARVRRLAEARGGFSIETIARVGYRLSETGNEAPDRQAEPDAQVAPASAPPHDDAVRPAPEHARAAHRRGWLAIALVTVAILAAGLYVGFVRDDAPRRAQQAKMLADIAVLVSQDRYGAAFARARPLSDSMSTDPAFAALWSQIVVPMRPLVSEPGATVYFKPYDDIEGEWTLAGTTPLEAWIEAPRGAVRLKIEKDGYRTGYFVVAVPGPSVETTETRKFPFDVPSVPLEIIEAGRLSDDLVFVPHTDVPVYLAGWSTDLLGSDRHDVPEFAIGRSEVTNREFKEFVDAGGYDNPAYWQGLQFIHEGRTLSWVDARRRFVDTTGRPGPAGWELSTYPKGRDDDPVGGISWYEAVAYARFRGQMLPTIHHWVRGAFSPYDPMFPTSAAIATQSRFFAETPESAHSERGAGPWGTHHMAGNAREWVWNFAGSAAVALGGSWTEYPSNLTVVYTADPMSRLPDHGLRLMRPLTQAPIDDALLEPIRLVRDSAFANRAPVSDEAFEAMRFQFTALHEAPIETTVKQIEESALWVAEEIVLRFATQEPTTLYIVRPKSHEGPLQPVVYSGVGDCCFRKRPNREALEQLQVAEFIVNSGRALVMPIWAGGYERYDPYPRDLAAAADRDRRITLLWQHDLSATLDYIETRPDMNADKIGYFGISRGASFAGAINLAIEPRIDAAVLVNGGIWIHTPLHPMVDLMNYAPRIDIPVLMLSSRFDHVYPYEQSQKRTFNLLGTPHDRKKQIAYDTGHFTMPRNRMAADATDWLDRYLGPAGGQVSQTPETAATSE